MTSQNQVIDFYLKQHEPQKSCFLAIRSIILDSNPQLREALKYKMPCFIFKGKNVCYLWRDKTTYEPYVLFVEGKDIDHPKLEVGSRSKMKILPIPINQDIPANVILDLIEQSITIIKNRL